MRTLFAVISVALYCAVGIISMVMACKLFLAKTFLPFHEKAANKSWDEIEGSLQFVILTLLRISGLGFFISALTLFIIALANIVHPDIYFSFIVPVLPLIFCIGLFIINYLLYKKTHANTPWKETIYSIVILLLGMIFSLIGRF